MEGRLFQFVVGAGEVVEGTDIRIRWQRAEGSSEGGEETPPLQAAAAEVAGSKGAWWATLACRQKDALAFYCRKHGVATDHAVDVSQSISRLCHGVAASDGRMLAPTLLPGTQLWLTRLERLMVGQEACLVQGWPLTEPAWAARADASGESSAFFAGLAGNAFPATVFAALMTGFIFGTEWQAVPSASTSQSGVAGAQALLASLVSPLVSRPRPADSSLFGFAKH